MPATVKRYEKSIGQPALCEQLRIRDLLDNVAVQINGALVAGYEVSGIHSYYASDDDRNRTKTTLEALVRSLPERSIRMQVRFEISEGTGDLIAQYNRQQRNSSEVLHALDQRHLEAWRAKEQEGFFLKHFLHLYFIWDPRIHHQSPDFEWKQKMRSSNTLSLSVNKCIERSRREHEDLVMEFDSLLSVVEVTLQFTGMTVRRMTHNDIFLEVKRALNPSGKDVVPYRPAERSLWYESARSQMANVNVENELDDYLKVGGLLYSWISLKDLPDATFPGVLHELISSSLKSCQMSLVVATRTSKPTRNHLEHEQAERILADRRQRVLHAITRMNGARGIPETLAQKRLFFSGLPAMAGENKRELDALTLHTADLLPVEMPWRGTPNSPLMLFETPYRQLVPFSPFDSGLGDANMLIMAKSGGGKTFMAQLFLLMMARANPLISILERGDSYQPLVELMGGRVIEVNLEGTETLNPWDLPLGETIPGKEKIAFLKNLTRHMIGDSPHSDTSLLDNLLSDAISRTYKRCAIRYSNPIPTFNDLREELANWRDEEKMQRSMDEAHLAAIKLRAWTGEKGIYSRLFDAQTTMRLDSNWLFFNVEGLSSDPRLETAMSMLIANAMAARAASKTGLPSITVLDECWSLLDSPTLAPEVVQLFRTARKRNSSVWGISQTVEDFVGSEFQPREHA